MADLTPLPPPPAMPPRYADWLTIAQVADLVGGTAERVRTWIVTGVKTEAGRVHLRAAKVGTNWRVNPTDVAPFVDALTRAFLPPSAAAPGSVPTANEPAPESPARERKRVADCMARLKAKGLA